MRKANKKAAAERAARAARRRGGANPIGPGDGTRSRSKVAISVENESRATKKIATAAASTATATATDADQTIKPDAPTKPSKKEAVASRSKPENPKPSKKKVVGSHSKLKKSLSTDTITGQTIAIRTSKSSKKSDEFDGDISNWSDSEDESAAAPTRKKSAACQNKIRRPTKGAKTVTFSPSIDNSPVSSFQSSVPRPSPTSSPEPQDSFPCPYDEVGLCVCQDILPADMCGSCKSAIVHHWCAVKVKGAVLNLRGMTDKEEGELNKRCMHCLTEDMKISKEEVKMISQENSENKAPCLDDNSSDNNSSDDKGGGKQSSTDLNEHDEDEDADYDDDTFANGIDNEDGDSSDEDTLYYDDIDNSSPPPYGIPFFQGKEESLNSVSPRYTADSLPSDLNFKDRHACRDKHFKVPGRKGRLPPMCLIMDAPSIEAKIHILSWWSMLDQHQQRALFEELKEYYESPSTSNKPVKGRNASEADAKAKRCASCKAALKSTEEYTGAADCEEKRKAAAEKSFSKKKATRSKAKKNSGVPAARGDAAKLISQFRARPMSRKHESLVKKAKEMTELAKPIPGQKAEYDVTVIIRSNVRDGRADGYWPMNKILVPDDKLIKWVYSRDEEALVKAIGVDGKAHLESNCSDLRICYGSQPLRVNAPKAASKKKRPLPKTPSKQKNQVIKVGRKRDAAAAAAGAKAAPAHTKRRRTTAKVLAF